MSRRLLMFVLFTCLPIVGWTQDTTPPTVAIKTLADQEHVGGVLTIEADASDGVGVTCVKFF